MRDNRSYADDMEGIGKLSQRLRRNQRYQDQSDDDEVNNFNDHSLHSVYGNCVVIDSRANTITLPAY